MSVEWKTLHGAHRNIRVRSMHIYIFGIDCVAVNGTMMAVECDYDWVCSPESDGSDIESRTESDRLYVFQRTDPEIYS